MVVREVRPEGAAQVALVERDHMVEVLAADRAHHSPGVMGFW
jgi:hypothetical protein